MVSAFRNKFEQTGFLIPKYGNLSFPEFAQLIITESEHYEEMDIREVNVHWRPYYLSPCTFCDLPFTGKEVLHRNAQLDSPDFWVVLRV